MKIITFYSYKGGACRTSTALNTIPFLVDELGATKEKPLLVLDMDLDSAGITYLLGQEQKFAKDYNIKNLLSEGIIGGPRKRGEIADHAFFKKCALVGSELGVENEAVLFLGCDETNANVDRNEISGGKGHLHRLIMACKNHSFSGIVIDSASGDQMIAQIAFLVATNIVTCLRPTRQFRIGTFNFLDRMLNNLSESDNNELVILPTAVPKEDVNKQRTRSENDIYNRTKDLNCKYVNIAMISGKRFGIPEVARFKWEEQVLYLLNKNGEICLEDEKEALECYSALGKVLSQ